MDEPNEYLVAVPRDAEGDAIEALAQFGVTAVTIVPEARAAGTIRVSRVGGDLVAQQQRDRPLLLVEAWENDSPAAYDSAIRAWAVFRTLAERGQILPGVAFTNVDLQAPRALDDPLAPDLVRFQFVVEGMVPLTEISITEET